MPFGNPDDALRLAQRELFDPLGMRHVTLSAARSRIPDRSSDWSPRPRDIPSNVSTASPRRRQ